MPDENPERAGHHHHTIRERLDAAEAAADEVVADGSGQLAGEVSGLALPFEEAVAALKAALHPDDLAEHETRTDPHTAAEAPPASGND